MIFLQKAFLMRHLFLFTFFYASVYSQSTPSKDFFRSPLDIPMQLAGNFGELRPNHFHAGLDFKTNQQEGLNIYAVADGYVSRIKISTYGYGKAIYITHENGYTSVYGHLQKSVGKIQDYIINESYNQKSYEIEMFPNKNELLVKKGDIIGISGNTGGSEGPHLHFEIRDAINEKAINPFLVGFDRFLKDSKKPYLSALLVYPIDGNSIVNQSKRPVALNISLQQNGTYVSEKVLASGKIGFGVTSADVDDISYNSNGIFKAQSFENGNPNFGYQFDTINFEEARYINALIDFTRYKKTHQRVQKLFMKNPYPLSNIKTNELKGIINVDSNFSESYKIEISDFFGNKTIVTIPIEYSALPSKIAEPIATSKYVVKANSESNFEKGNWSVFFPEHTFYEDFNLNFDANDSILNLHDDSIPVHSNFKVSFEDTLKLFNSKSFIASVKDKKINYNNTKIKNNTFSTYTKNLGQFKLLTDSIKPKITITKPIEGKTINQKTIQFFISDELSGIKSYDGFINGKWVLFEFEPKNRKLTHTITEGKINAGKNVLKLVVVDNVGNSTTFETTFFFNQKTK